MLTARLGRGHVFSAGLNLQLCLGFMFMMTDAAVHSSQPCVFNRN